VIQGLVGSGQAGVEGCGLFRYGLLRQGWAWQAGYGKISYGGATCGLFWYGRLIERSQNMVYQWKTPGFYKVDAQTAGAELERISAQGSLTPQNVVDESRSETAVLHNCFDWNDATAAESYRQVQAREIVRNIITVNIDGEPLKGPVRAFVSIQGNYEPMGVVIKTKDYQEEMLSKALRELRSFQNKYAGLSELSEVFASISAFENALEQKTA